MFTTAMLLNFATSGQRCPSILDSPLLRTQWAGFATAAKKLEIDDLDLQPQRLLALFEARLAAGELAPHVGCDPDSLGSPMFVL